MSEFNPDIEKKVSNLEESVRNMDKKQEKVSNVEKTSCFLEIKIF